MSRRGHTHPCSRCDRDVPCSGEWESNYDGFPEVICAHYHLESGRTAQPLCEECAEDAEQEDKGAA